MKIDASVVLFDVVDTLIRAKPPASEAYFRLGRRFGSRLARETIQGRFSEIRGRLFGHLADDPANVDLPTDEQFERQRWLKIVDTIFDDLADTGPLFEALWSYFENAAHWDLYPDVIASWRRLRSHGVTLGLATNFDRRFRSLHENLTPLDEAEFVFISSELGFSKPDSRFYALAQERIGLTPDRIAIIGDDPVNDFWGPRACGWKAILIDRGGTRKLRPSIRSLDELV